MTPKKGKEGQWKRMQPELYTPDFLTEKKNKDQQAIDIDELKELLSKPRQAV